MADVPTDPKSLTDEQLGQAIEATVREFLKNEGGSEDVLGLPADHELWTQFDSLLIMELLVHLEERFGVPLNTGKLSPDDLKTIGRIRDVATKAIRAAQS
ncbi:MAG TPA: acyl carrier protein [Polyangiaceae bacterium]|nr:acyl carrier protein [Polyangiaceae bacterium]